MDAAEMKRRRERLGMSQFKFAVRIGVTASTVSSWEIGRSKVPNWMTTMLELLDREAGLPAEPPTKPAKKRR